VLDVRREERSDAQHGVAADSPPSLSLGPLASLARLAAERPTVRPPNEHRGVTRSWVRSVLLVLGAATLGTLVSRAAGSFFFLIFPSPKVYAAGDPTWYLVVFSAFLPAILGGLLAGLALGSVADEGRTWIWTVGLLIGLLVLTPLTIGVRARGWQGYAGLMAAGALLGLWLGGLTRRRRSVA
jgi:hypothetical protein